MKEGCAVVVALESANRTQRKRAFIIEGCLQGLHILSNSLLRVVEIHAVDLHVGFGKQTVVVGQSGIKNDLFSCGKESTVPNVMNGGVPPKDKASEIRDNYAIINKEYAFDM